MSEHGSRRLEREILRQRNKKCEITWFFVTSDVAINGVQGKLKLSSESQVNVCLALAQSGGDDVNITVDYVMQSNRLCKKVNLLTNIDFWP